MAQRGILAFTDTAALEARIEEYFQSRWQTRKMRSKTPDGSWNEWEESYRLPPTMAGLALALDTNRTTLLHYGKGEGTRDLGFIAVIARAKMRVAEFAEEALYAKEASIGARFALEVNHGYGREDREGGTGDGFNVLVIPPARSDVINAIPKWEPEGSDDE